MADGGVCLLTAGYSSGGAFLRSSATSKRTSLVPVFIGRFFLISMFVLDCGVGEPVFHRRDHKDQGAYGSRPNIYSVQTFDDAMKYLSKYGYLNCSNSSLIQNLSITRHQHQHPGKRSHESIITLQRHHHQLLLQSCSEAEIQDALRTLQAKFKLRPTGRLDEATKQTMSKGRCGNTDKEQQVVAPVNHVDDESSGTVSNHGRNRSVHVRKPTGKRKLRNGVKNGRVIRASAGHLHEALVEGEVTSHRAHHRRTARSIIDAEEGFSGNSLDRRLDMLREFTEKMRLSEQRNATRAERRMARWITGPGSRARARRRRRSVLAGFVDQVVEEGTSGSSVRTRIVNDESKPVKWRLLQNGESGKIPLVDQKSVLELSFRMWSEVIPIKFVENDQLGVNLIDIVIAFGRDTHLNCEKPFDGNGGELAHSWAAGDIHFDEDENYKKDGTGIDLLKVAVHEVGHVLGLIHNERQTSIMFPIYVSPQSQEDFELVREDRKAVQDIYGVCKGAFDVVFDWVRRVEDPASYRPKYIFNTYFFRSTRYWMYENAFNRTRYGDPLLIEQQWSGLPSHLDSFTQVVLGSGNDFQFDTYFFKGEVYYKYNSATDRVMDGYPRNISHDFGPAPNSTESIPDYIDAVYFNSTDNLLYFFKTDWVWIYDPAEIGRNGCCVSKQRFTDLYPTSADPDDSDPSPLTGDIDSAYYSYNTHTTYMFKGELVYEVIANASSVSVRKLSQWFHVWYDICEVD